MTTASLSSCDFVLVSSVFVVSNVVVVVVVIMAVNDKQGSTAIIVISMIITSFMLQVLLSLSPLVPFLLLLFR